MDGVYLDLETNPDTADIRLHEIIEIGAVSVEGGAATSTFRSFVRPARPLTERVISLTGISEAMLEAAPDLRSALEDFLGFVGDRRLIRSEEHTSALQSREKLVCRLLLDKKQ